MTSGRRQGNLAAIGFMLLSGACFSVMHATVRKLGADLHPFEVAFFRSFFGFLFLLPLLFQVGFSHLKANNPGLLTVRAVVNLAAMLMFFTALTMAPLADVAALAFTAPIFATLLAIPFLGEKVGWRRALAIAAGFTGAMVVVRPGFGTLDLGHALVIGSAFIWASVMLLIKHISKTESSLTITLYMGLLMTPISLPFALPFWIWPDGVQWAWLAFIGASGGLAQWSLAEALKRGETASIMPLDFMKLVWAALIGFVAFSEIPGLDTAVGGVLIFGAATFIAIREAQIKRKAMTS